MVSTAPEVMAREEADAPVPAFKLTAVVMVGACAGEVTALMVT
jgi:hypothetical protein